MATAASILAVVRAAAPTVSSPQEALVFALHAAVLAGGYRLVAVGDQAQLEGLSPDAPDVPVAGWSSGGGEAYTFAYLSEEPPAAAAATTAAAGTAAAAPAAVMKLLLRVVPVGDVLLASLATDAESAQPQTLELPLGEYVTYPVSNPGSGGSSGGTGGTDAAAAGAAGATAPLQAAKAYKNLDGLASAVNGALAALTAASTGSGGGAGASASGGQKKQCTSSSTSAAAAAAQERDREGEGLGRPAEPRRPQQPHHSDHDPLRIGPPRRPPMRIGEDDVMPILGGGGIGGMGGGIGGGMLPGGPPLPGGGGGMHVGPGHPFFADRMRHPDVMPGRGPGGPGGVRWDPINPEGLQGWHPEDFQRPRPGQQQPGSPGGFRPDIDPDLAQPGPGRGTDWDNMYG